MTKARSKSDKACRTCALYDLDYAKDGAGRIRRGAVAACHWESKEIVPASVRDRPRTAHWMQPDDGTMCPCWENRS